MLGELALRDHASAMVHQVRQHAEFVGRQFYLNAVEGDPHSGRRARPRRALALRRYSATEPERRLNALFMADSSGPRYSRRLSGVVQ